MTTPDLRIVLALDQSTRATGWAIGGTDGRKPVWGVFELPPWGTDEGAMMVRLNRFLRETIAAHGITDIIFEKPLLTPVDTVEKLVKLYAVPAIIMFTAADVDCRISWVDQKTWRKRAFGQSRAVGLKGQAATDWLKAAAIKACGWAGHFVEDHNAAEALCILDYGLSALDRRHAGRTDPIFRRAEYQADIRRRMALVLAGPVEKKHAINKARGKGTDAGPLFDEAAE